MSDESKTNIQLLRSVVEGQKALVDALSKVVARYDETQTALLRLVRQQSALDGNIAELKSEVGDIKSEVGGVRSGIAGLGTRMDALHRRLDEIDIQIDSGFRKAKELQSDLFTEQNQSLNALNASIENNAELTCG